jgi:cell division protein FtsW
MICAIVALPSALVLIEPDLGTGMFLVGLGFMVALAGGLRLMHLVPTIVAFIPPLMGLFWYRFDHFRERISVFLNPGSDPLGTGHQIRQSLIAIGSGGQYGAGLGLSRQKLFYLPQPNSDFIFSIIAEETGFAGCLLIILLYMGIVWFGFQIARRARDRFGSFVATGITLCITIQALLNIAVATAVFPTKGLPLPLVSKGGSSLVVTVIMVGVLLAIHNSGTDEISKTSERHGQPQPDV